MKTQELNNTKISGSSWSWPNSLHFSLSKPIQTARTSERYSQTQRATWKRERQAELPKRDTLHPTDLSSSHAVNFWFSTFISHHYPGVGYWWCNWVISEPVVVGSPKVKINKKQPHNAGQYPWVELIFTTPLPQYQGFLPIARAFPGLLEVTFYLL